jgi:RNA polymerase sigma factor (sigma-70 family)
MQLPRNYSADLDLIQRVCGADNKAWEDLVQRHSADVRGAVLRTLQSRNFYAPPATVEDIQGDLWLGLVADNFRRLSAYSGRCSLRQWLKVVASNHVVDFLRKQRPTIPIATGPEDLTSGAIDLPSHEPDAPTLLHQHQQTAALLSALAQLSDEDRLFVELYYHRELSFERVAELMGTTVGATYARKNRLRKRILNALGDSAPESLSKS